MGQWRNKGITPIETWSFRVWISHKFFCCKSLNLLRKLNQSWIKLIPKFWLYKKDNCLVLSFNFVETHRKLGDFHYKMIEDLTIADIHISEDFPRKSFTNNLYRPVRKATSRHAIRRIRPPNPAVEVVHHYNRNLHQVTVFKIFFQAFVVWEEVKGDHSTSYARTHVESEQFELFWRWNLKFCGNSQKNGTRNFLYVSNSEIWIEWNFYTRNCNSINDYQNQDTKSL